MAYNNTSDIEKAITSAPNLRKLELVKNKVDKEMDFPQLFKILSQSKLQEFSACQQHCWNDQAVDALAQWIESPTCTLEFLHISVWNAVRTPANSLWTALAKNSSLRKFKCSSPVFLISIEKLEDLLNCPTSQLTSFVCKCWKAKNTPSTEDLERINSAVEKSKIKKIIVTAYGLHKKSK